MTHEQLHRAYAGADGVTVEQPPGAWDCSPGGPVWIAYNAHVVRVWM